MSLKEVPSRPAQPTRKKKEEKTSMTSITTVVTKQPITQTSTPPPESLSRRTHMKRRRKEITQGHFALLKTPLSRKTTEAAAIIRHPKSAAATEEISRRPVVSLSEQTVPLTVTAAKVR